MRLKKGLLIAAMFGLFACSSSQPDKTYYQLPADATQAKQSAAASEKRGFVWIESLNLADFLSEQGIAYQVSEVSYINANSHLWLAPLETQLQDQLVQQLSEALPSQLVSTKRMTKPSLTVSAKITGFHGRFDGTVVVSGEWVVHNASTDKFVTKSFNHVVDLPKDGYEVLVTTLAAAWHDEVKALSNLIIETR